MFRIFPASLVSDICRACLLWIWYDIFLLEDWHDFRQNSNPKHKEKGQPLATAYKQSEYCSLSSSTSSTVSFRFRPTHRQLPWSFFGKNLKTVIKEYWCTFQARRWLLCAWPTAPPENSACAIMWLEEFLRDKRTVNILIYEMRTICRLKKIGLRITIVESRMMMWNDVDLEKCWLKKNEWFCVKKDFAFKSLNESKKVAMYDTRCKGKNMFYYWNFIHPCARKCYALCNIVIFSNLSNPVIVGKRPKKEK